jgi:hypothetical protein
MDKQELVAEGIGEVPAWLAEEGLALAKRYFEDNNIDAETCFKAKGLTSRADLTTHWQEAEKLANTVLEGNAVYKNSMISLNYDTY